MKLDVGDIESLKPVIAAAVAETIARIATDEARLPAKQIGLPEAQAAEALGVARHVLRDCRLRGEITARRVGSRFVYSRAALLKWLEANND